MARKNGCPMNVRNWQIDILSRAATKENPTWIRIKGLTSMTYSVDGDTEDGSSAENLWGEPYVTKRNGSFDLEAKPVFDAVTGAQDAGQAELDYYSTQGGCDGDAVIRIADPYGHASILDVVVTSTEKSADDTSETRSWSMEIVGEPEDQAYVQVTGVTVKVGTGTASTSATASVTVGGTQACTVVIAPTTASNQKYSVASANTGIVKVTNIDGLSFNLTGVSAGTADVVIKTMNNAATAKIATTVTTA